MKIRILIGGLADNDILEHMNWRVLQKRKCMLGGGSQNITYRIGGVAEYEIWEHIDLWVIIAKTKMRIWGSFQFLMNA